MSLKAFFSQLFSGSSPIAAFLYSKKLTFVYKVGGFRDMPENSNFDSVNKVRRLVK